jgi:hypothetical protein
MHIENTKLGFLKLKLNTCRLATIGHIDYFEIGFGCGGNCFSKKKKTFHGN